MKFAIASDHAGFIAKVFVIRFLKENGHQVQDFGCSSQESCDYPDFGIPAVRAVASEDYHRGILICSNGIGMSMLANKIPNILAALVYDPQEAMRTRQHHGSNVLCLGASRTDVDIMIQIIRNWINTEFEGDRHERRINKVLALDKH